ncbi:tyrosine-protein phosphatase [Tundrisphaera sp. TA3]|uniref:tyrosine-protein phosphatase n=1 Tax=Tundrisphaera sp. TA3 TaxID=3435775 RepID=UPI003EBB04C6
MTIPRRLRWALRSVALAGLVAAGLAAWLFLGDNFAAIRPGQLYRSGQLGRASLEAKLRDHRIKTVLNLRGAHPEADWYRDERAATLAAGGTQVDMALSSCEWMSRAQARALLEILDRAEKPILVHCFHGSERTGITCAFAELLRPGSTLADAREQFTLRYLYTGYGDGVVTFRHLERYEAWLNAQKAEHSPERFRAWIADGFEPGSPCREQWDFDPYPLVVTTRAVPRVAARQE